MPPTKILIISYFFYPCNLPGAQRIYSWAKYFREFGLYPVVITRNWDIPIKTSRDLFLESGKELRHEKLDGYEIYYLPYKENLRDKLIHKYGERRMVLFRKALTFFDLLSQNFTTKFLHYHSFYRLGKELLKKDPGIKLLLTSGMPFGLFRICHELHQKTRLPWIADYRDDWNTTAWTSNYDTQSQISGKKSLAEKFLATFERRSEKKWVGSAEIITTVSRHYVNKISNYVVRPGKVVYNGFDVPPEMLNNGEQKNNNSPFTISYTGNLYFSQNIEIFIKGFFKAYEQLGNPEIRLNFIGTAYDDSQGERLKKYLGNTNCTINLTGWTSQKEVFEYIKNSHLLLAVANAGIKGVIPSKVFVYLAFRKPVLLCPSDHDEMEEVLAKSGTGLIANDEDTTCEMILKVYQKFKNNQPIISPNEEFIEEFSRKKQAEKLAGIIHRILVEEQTA